MKKRISIIWTPQAREDVRSIRTFIARDAPKTATAFVRRLRRSVNRLRTFPRGGEVVPEIGNADIREIFFGMYRIIYHLSNDHIEILTVYHGARLLDGTD
jgi:toxin ParE1/3/4